MVSLWTIRYIVSPLSSLHGYLTRGKDGTTFHRRLAELLDPAVPASPKGDVATFDAVIDSSTGLRVRIFVPTPPVGHCKEETMPVMLYFHGGGFVMFRPDSALYDQFCRRLAMHCRVVVVSVHYRRAPEHKWPAAYDDCYAALEWVKTSEQARTVLPTNADASRTFLCGDSAGGNIAHHLAVRAAGKDHLGLQGLVLIQPFFGGEDRTPAERNKDSLVISVETLDYFWKMYLPHDANRDHPASHVFGSRLPSVHVPPMLVIVGGRDILQDWNRRYVEEMKKAGKQVQLCFYEEGVHIFGHLNQAGVAEQMLIDIATFLENHQD